jgi:hypothetical protein
VSSSRPPLSLCSRGPHPRSRSVGDFAPRSGRRRFSTPHRTTGNGRGKVKNLDFTTEGGLPDRRVVIRFDFTGRPRRERYWPLIELGDTEICKTHPGPDEDLYVTAEAEAFVKWHAGQLPWAEATREDRIQLEGSPSLVRAFPTWNARSMFAHIRRVSRTVTRAVG